jgi:hypothetical protein
LPLLGLFTGARLGEIASLSSADVKMDELTNIHSISPCDGLRPNNRQWDGPAVLSSLSAEPWSGGVKEAARRNNA